jgi:DNA-binding transcriptional LysR family regulator
MIEFRHLRSFLAVADQLHFGRAAEQLHITQPPLTRQIKQLEGLLGGVALFDRTHRSVTLTDAGERFVEEARRLLDQLTQSVEVTQRVARGESGRLRIGFVTTADYHVLPALLTAFAKRYPGVDVELLELTGDEQLRQLAAGTLDVGILIPSEKDSNLGYFPLYREPLVAVVPRAHRLARRRGSISRRALRGESFVLFPRILAPSLYDKIIAYLANAGFSPTVSQEARQMQTIIGLVAGGMGVSVVPDCMQNLGRKDVVYKRLEPKTPEITTMLVWRRCQTSAVVDSLLGVCRGLDSSASRKS